MRTLIVKVARGFGPDMDGEDEQLRFLDWFKTVLEICGLQICGISSERPTGGPIVLEVPEGTEAREIIGAFQQLATTRSEEALCEIAFDLVIDGCGEPVTVVGEY